MRSTESLWRSLETTPVLTGVREAWTRIAGDDFPALQPLLRPTGRLAGSYPCSDPTEDGCSRLVVVHGDDDIVSVCGRSPVSCERRTHCREDLVVHRLDLTVLAQRLGRLLGVHADQPTPADGLARTVHVGSHRRAPAGSVPVYLTLPPGRGELAEVVERLAARSAGGFLLLTPSADAVTPALTDFLRTRGAATLALADLTVLDERAQLVASPHAAALLSAAGRGGAGTSPDDAATPPRDACIFRNQGATWSLAFDGIAASVEDSLGVGYVAELLRTPGVAVHTIRLRDVVAGEAPRAIGDAGEVLDKKALREIKTRLDAIRDEQDEAREFQDFARVERLEEEAEFLRGQVAQATGLGGRQRRASSDQERARQAVKKAVRRAIAAVGEVHPSLGRHLEQSIRTGKTLVYDPEPPRAWTM